jgi:hypothetical protein
MKNLVDYLFPSMTTKRKFSGLVTNPKVRELKAGNNLVADRAG